MYIIVIDTDNLIKAVFFAQTRFEEFLWERQLLLKLRTYSKKIWVKIELDKDHTRTLILKWVDLVYFQLFLCEFLA